MPKLAIGQQWEAVEIATDLRSADYQFWIFQIVYMARYEKRQVGLGLKLNPKTRCPTIDVDVMHCLWFGENGESFGDQYFELRLVRPLGSNARALRAPRFSDD